MLILKPSPRRAAWGSRKLTEMIALRNAGATLTEIGRHYGITRQAVSAALKNNTREVEEDHANLRQQ